MAYLASVANGNLTSSSTWALIDSTSYLDDLTANTALTTSYVASSGFTPGAITIDGIAVKLASRAASPSGTISVELYDNTAAASVAGTEVTLNVSDLPACSTTYIDGGWILFKFGSPVVLTAGHAYAVRAKTSSSSQVNLYRDGTSNNWSRMLRTTTNQAPVAGDTMHVMGEHTGAGTGTDYSVTMNSTTNTDYGPGDYLDALTINKRGSMSYGTTGSTNYYLKLSGNLVVFNGGTLNIGSSGAEIPRTSTAVLEFDPGDDARNRFYAKNGSTVNIQGLSRTSGKDVVGCRLTANVANNDTTANVDTDTGWLSGDEVVVTDTSKNNTREDTKETLSANAGATSMSMSSINNAHLGTAPYQGHVVLLTRNIQIRSATGSRACHFEIQPTSTVNLKWARFRYFGSFSYAGFEIDTTTGSFNMQYCTFDEGEMFWINMPNTANNVNMSFNVYYNSGTRQLNYKGGFIFDCTSSSPSVTITDNYFVGLFTASGGSPTASEKPYLQINNLKLTFSRNVMTSIVHEKHAVIYCNDSINQIGEFDDNEIYGCSAGYTTTNYVINTQSIAGGNVGNLKMWHNNTEAFAVTGAVANMTFTDCYLYGNKAGLYVAPSATLQNTDFIDSILSSSDQYTSTYGLRFDSLSSTFKTRFINCDIGYVTGHYAGNTNDLSFTSCYVDLLLDNCRFGGTTLMDGYTNLNSSAIVKFNKYNQTANDHRWYTKYGIGRSTGAGLADTTVKTSGSLGLRIAPENLSNGFVWEYKVIARANTAVSALGFIKKNAAFGSDVVTVELFLPGSTTADDSQIMGNDTNWNVFNLAASYTGSEDLYATVRITAKTTTSLAYIYVDDLFNGTNKITGIDVWDEGQPSPIMFEQLGDASAVWAVATNTLTTDGTTGKALVDAKNNTTDTVGLIASNL